MGLLKGFILTKLSDSLLHVHFDIVNQWNKWFVEFFISLSERIKVSLLIFHMVVLNSLESFHSVEEFSVYMHNAKGVAAVRGFYLIDKQNWMHLINMLKGRS